MDVMFVVDDNRVNGFTPSAKNELIEICKEYVEGIIEEAKRIEQNDRSGNTQAEVIASHVIEAKKNYRRTPPRKTKHIVIDVMVDILALILGALFNKESLTSSNAYLIVYIILIFVTVVLLIVKYSRKV